MSRGSGPNELIWLREEPGARRPSHSRAQIAAAAVEIADREGFGAVSMRRVAMALGSGTMTLYHYVRNKDELVMLMHDAVMGEVLVPGGELPADWREALRMIAGRSRAAFARHPWTLDRLDGLTLGPNAVRHFEQSLRAVSGTGLPAEERLHILSLVDEYVMGFSLREGADWSGAEDPEAASWPSVASEFFRHELESGEYPLIEELMSEELGESDPAEATVRAMAIISDPVRFERGLEQLLDGVEAGFASAGRKPSRTRANAARGARGRGR
jgi:AcrR family transcriptional regulator